MQSVIDVRRAPASLRKLHKLGELLAVPRYRHALRHGVAAGVEHAAMLRTLRCAQVFDIGANKGQFSLAVRVCMPEARIVAFEPLPGPASVFRKVFAGDPQVELHEVAIGATPGLATMHVSRRQDSSSLLPITRAQEAFFPGTAEVTRQQVRLELLKSLVGERISTSALLKLDVQGYELQALKGCQSVLPGMAFVYVECSFVELYGGQALADDVVTYLRDSGFMLRGVYNVTYSAVGVALQADLLFANGESNS